MVEMAFRALHQNVAGIVNCVGTWYRSESMAFRHWVAFVQVQITDKAGSNLIGVGLEWH